jgi:hypothetical protein
MKSLLTLAVLAGLAGSADAVVLNPRGTGQVLLYPYYTVRGGNNTLLTVANTDDDGNLGRGKAVRVIFREGENGRPVLEFNVYLGRHESFAATVFANGDGAALVAADTACTFPAIANSTTLPQLPDGRRYIAFGNGNYSGAANDPGSDGLERVREGWIEVIEMGTIPTAAPAEADVTLCRVDAAWNGGYWATNPKTDLINPTGGLTGSVAVINVARGTIASVAATALDDFRTDPAADAASSSVVRHTRPDPQTVELDDALNDPATGRATALVQGTSGSLRLTYATGEDAVSAVLMSTALHGDFETDEDAGASTSVVLNYPTRRHYTDFGAAGPAWRPFAQPYGGVRTDALDIPYDKLYDRNGNSFDGNCGFLCPPPQPASYPGTSVEAISVFRATDPVLQSRLTAHTQQFATILERDSGTMTLHYRGVANHPNSARLAPSLEGVVVQGMPVIGFVLTNYINSNVTGGVLANYSSAVPLRSVNWCDSDASACD